MTTIYVSWCISAAVLLALAAVVGWKVTGRIDGILIDTRGRYSLTHFQFALWTITVLSLLSGVFFGRLLHGVANPLTIHIPAPVLWLMGISAGSAVAATAVKRNKDLTQSDHVAVSGGTVSPPQLSQMFLAEEGTFANQAMDITKFQGFIITILLIAAYIAASVSKINVVGTALATLPTVNFTLVGLFGISHGAYVAGKIPTSAGYPPDGLSMADRDAAEDPSVYHVLSRKASRPSKPARAPKALPAAEPAAAAEPGHAPEPASNGARSE
jgi:hypothetical protein